VKSQKPQSGSALVIGIIIIVILILGTLGFVYWQNFLNKPQISNSTTASTGQPSNHQVDSGQSSDSLTETAQDQTLSTQLAVKYPKTWTSVHTSVVDDTTSDIPISTDKYVITSTDGAVEVTFSVAQISGIGGSCGDESSVIGDPIRAINKADIPGYQVAAFMSYISYINETGQYHYVFNAVKNNDQHSKSKVGDSACNSYIFADLVPVEGKAGVFVKASAKFKSLYKSNGYDLVDNITQEKIQAAFDSTDGKVAESIIKSLYVK